MTKVWTVLRTGYYYEPAHVDLLRRQLAKVSPDVELICLTDSREVRGVRTVALQFGYRAWWAKMELMCQPHDEDILYLDLDNVAVGDISEMLSTPGSVLLRDFSEQGDAVGSGVMRLTARDRARIWSQWVKRPDAWMHEFRMHGDRKFIEGVIGRSAPRWQDVLPGHVISYKLDVAGEGLWAPPSTARVVAFHGQPRPWQVRAEWIRKAAA